ncbi:hypothetical protein SAMN05216269_1101, partial [Flavobacterium xinjiangense]
MKRALNILIVDDHPMTVDSYINLLLEVELQDFKPNFIKCYNCKGAYDAILFHSKQNINIDLTLIDLNLLDIPLQRSPRFRYKVRHPFRSKGRHDSTAKV